MAVLSEYLDDRNSFIDIYKELFPDKYREVDIPRRVGFDRVVVSCEVERIDWEEFDVALKSEEGMKKTLYAYDCRDEKKILDICKGEKIDHWYSSIIVKIANNTLTIKKCNLPDHRDTCIFEICISPIEGHEVLGNISNNTCDQEKRRVLHLIGDVERYGIFLDRDIAILKKLELNVNLVMFGGYLSAMEILRPYRQCLKGFKFSDYSEHGESKIRFANLNSEGYVIGQELNIQKLKTTSFNSESASRKIRIYDKSAETIEKSNGKIDYIYTLTRIEFALTDAKEVLCYFKKSNNLFSLTQDDIEEAFHKMTLEWLKKPLEEYYRQWNRRIEKIFEQIDIHKHQWKKMLVLELDNNIKKSDGFLLITKNELSSYVSLINGKSISKNRARIADQLEKAFNEAACVSIVDSSSYDELLDWLWSIKGEQKQNIYYLINDKT